MVSAGAAAQASGGGGDEIDQGGPDAALRLL